MLRRRASSGTWRGPSPSASRMARRRASASSRYRWALRPWTAAESMSGQGDVERYGGEQDGEVAEGGEEHAPGGGCLQLPPVAVAGVREPGTDGQRRHQVVPAQVADEHGQEANRHRRARIEVHGPGGAPGAGHDGEHGNPGFPVVV